MKFSNYNNFHIPTKNYFICLKYFMDSLLLGMNIKF